MPISLSGTRITVEWQSGDPASFTIDDIYLKSVADGWSPAVQKIDSGVYIIPYSLYIQGSSTIFYAGANTEDRTITILFNPSAPTDLYVLNVTGCSFVRFGYSTVYGGQWGVNVIVDPVVPLNNRRIYFNGKIELLNSQFDYVWYGNILGADSSNRCTVKNCQFIHQQFGWSTNEYTEIEDCQSIGGFYGSAVNGIYSLDGYLIKNVNIGSIIAATSGTARNLKFKNVNSWHTYLRCGNTATKTIDYVDCELDTSKVYYYISGTTANTVNTQNVKTTLTVTVYDKDENLLDGANVKVYGVDDTLLLDDNTVDGVVSGEVLYFKRVTQTNAGSLVSDVTTDYEPLKVIVNKDGVGNITIPKIYVDAGIPTNQAVQLRPLTKMYLGSTELTGIGV